MVDINKEISTYIRDGLTSLEIYKKIKKKYREGLNPSYTAIFRLGQLQHSNGAVPGALLYSLGSIDDSMLPKEYRTELDTLYEDLQKKTLKKYFF